MGLNVQNFRIYIICTLFFVSTCKHFISSKHMEFFKNGIFHGEQVVFFQNYYIRFLRSNEIVWDFISVRHTFRNPNFTPFYSITIQNIWKSRKLVSSKFSTYENFGHLNFLNGIKCTKFSYLHYFDTDFCIVLHVFYFF